jgi:hypothetical protein
MDKKPFDELFPALALITMLSLIGVVLWMIGIPRAGAWSALTVLAVASFLALGMAYFFSHGPKTGH